MGGEEEMNPVFSHALIGLATLILGVCIGYSLSERKKFNYQLVQNITVGIISLLAMSVLLVSITEYQNKTECQARYNISFTQSIKDGREAADADRRALLEMVSVLQNPEANEAQRTEAFNHWAKTLNETDKKRAASPLPPAPDCAKD
jgi:hypothetical protein